MLGLAALVRGRCPAAPVAGYVLRNAGGGVVVATVRGAGVGVPGSQNFSAVLAVPVATAEVLEEGRVLEAHR